MGISALARSKIRVSRPEPNPVLVKELRSRFRGPRAFTMLTAFLVLLSGVAVLLYRMQVQDAYHGGYGSSSAAAEIGRFIFGSVAFLEVFLLAFIAPALTMNAISGEVERQTYELLLATPLSGWSILRGKVGSAMAYVLLLIFSALPVMSLAFLFGGVPGTAVAVAQISATVFGLLFVVIGVFYSSLFKRTSRSAIASYATIAAISILPVFFVIVFDIFIWGTDADLENLLFQLSPFMVMGAMVGDWLSSGRDGAELWAQSILLHTVLAGILYALAGARIRRVGRGVAVSLGFLVALLWAWASWVLFFSDVSFF